MSTISCGQTNTSVDALARGEMSTGRKLELHSLRGDQLREAFAAGTVCLDRYKDKINALNVFPVPDGDTGTNMFLTMRAVNEDAAKTLSADASKVSSAMAKGALLGARGNSGVILSQFFNGISQGLRGKDVCDSESFCQALDIASTISYNSVSNPVEGTILTIIKAFSQAANHHFSQGGRNILDMWETALTSAKEALTRTPLQLPKLQEAGVVDAGGQGLVVLLEGAFYYLSGLSVDNLEMEMCTPVEGTNAIVPQMNKEYRMTTEEEIYGYCTQFLVESPSHDADQIRQQLTSLGDSTVVVGDKDLVKIHVHAHDPGPIISYGVSLGPLSKVTLENIDQQHQEFMVKQLTQQDEATDVAVVAVVWGEGFSKLFQELGCDSVIKCGQTMNPSTAEILKVVESTRASQVILLTNNPNVIPAAKQAVSISTNKTLHLIPSKILTQGISALLSYNPEEKLETNLSEMSTALNTIRTIQITTADRSTTKGNLKINEGQFIALLDEDLISVGNDIIALLSKVIAMIAPPSGSMITLYRGSEAEESEAHQAANAVRSAAPGVEVEIVVGGQPHYQYIVSVE